MRSFIYILQTDKERRTTILLKVFIFTILFVSFLVTIYLYISSKNRQKTIQVITLNSFLSGQYIDQKTSVIDSLNNFFDNDVNIDGSDDSDMDDGIE